MQIPNYNITIGNQTNVGKVRSLNEDYMEHFATPLGYCIIVCDGMGGHAAGDVASQNAIEAIKHFLQNGKITKLDTALCIHNAIEFANYKLREMVQQNAALKGMGTTCVLALINNADLYIAHAGDSRIYLIRDKEIKQITKDHSVVQNLIDSGALSEEDAELSDKKNQITKAIGIFEKVEPTVCKTSIKLLQNDKILLCSDGLTTHVNAKQIVNIINEYEDVQLASIALIDAANAGGGTDNITAQIVHYTGKEIAVTTIKKNPTKKYILVFIIALILVSAGVFTYKKIIETEKKKVEPANTNTTKDTIKTNKTGK